MGLRERFSASVDAHDKLTREESIEIGKELRDERPFDEIFSWTEPEKREDPVELLKSQGKKRVAQLLPLRYERMSASAFTFYRGGALIMASDLSHLPTTGIEVQACGDAHISNFGLFFSPERRTVFDINDFDETCPGPWEWDVARLAASVEICGRDNGFSKKQRKAAAKAAAEGYRKAMGAFSDMGNLEVWYAHLDVDALKAQVLADPDAKASKLAEKTLSKAKAKGSSRAIQKLTEVQDDKLQIISEPPVIVPMRDLVESVGDGLLAEHFDEKTLEKMMAAVMKAYKKTLTADKVDLIESYSAVDMAHKVVGVGSVGTRAWIIVLKGAGESDPLVLQVKEAQESVLERFCGKSRYRQHGERVVAGQRAMQTASDMLLGWCRMPGLDGRMKDYYVRQLWDGKGSIDLSRLDPDQLVRLARACGWTLAHAHARTGDRFAIAAYIGDDDAFDKALAKFARAYADQNEADYARFMEALDAGELS